MSHTIKAKSKTGSIVHFDVNEIIEIDGHPYGGSTADMRDAFNHIDGRLTSLENVILSMSRLPGGDQSTA